LVSESLKREFICRWSCSTRLRARTGRWPDRPSKLPTSNRIWPEIVKDFEKTIYLTGKMGSNTELLILL